MKRLFLMLLVAFVCSANADAQGWLGRLKDKAVDAAKRTVENTVEQKTQESPMLVRQIQPQPHHQISNAALSSCSKTM